MYLGKKHIYKYKYLLDYVHRKFFINFIHVNVSTLNLMSAAKYKLLFFILQIRIFFLNLPQKLQKCLNYENIKFNFSLFVMEEEKSVKKVTSTSKLTVF